MSFQQGQMEVWLQVRSCDHACLVPLVSRRLHSHEELVPLVMFSRRSMPPAGEGFAQEVDIGNQVCLHPAPIGKLMAARSADLICEELHGTVLNPVVVRLDD